MSTKCAAVARKVYAAEKGLALVLLSPVIRQCEDGRVQEVSCFPHSPLGAQG